MVNNKLRNILYSIFVVAIVGVIIWAGSYIFSNSNASSETFISDGYTLYLSPNSIKASVVTFKKGNEYTYKKKGNKVAFEGNDGNVTLDDDSLIHYQNGSLVVLKNIVGIDLDTLEDEIILYYNLYKNTEIKKDSGEGYYIDSVSKKIPYKKMLLRITDNKYLLAGNNVRAVMFNDQVVDFGNYVYFEYVNGSVIKLYNNDKYYQMVSSDTTLVLDDITIDLKDKTISKDNVNRITLSNLVIDMDGNIDVITEEAKIDKGNIENPNISDDLLKPPVIDDQENQGGTINGNTDEEKDDQNENEGQEEKEEDKTTYKEPTFNVTNLAVTALKVDASIEITDEDGILLNPVHLSIMENATADVVYEEEIRDGNLSAYISYPNLKPDTEYTLYANGSYKADDLTLEKTFLSKIFRTEALGVSFRKSYVTKDSIVVDLYKESYSKVSSVTLGIYNEAEELIDYQKIDLLDKTKNKYQVEFNGLEHNKKYIVKMYDILSSGVVVDDGFSQIQTLQTLKQAPVIGDLTYRVNKSDSAFELSVNSISDDDYGIYNYRYEIFDARQDLSVDEPVLTLEQKKIGPINVLVDDNKIHRGVAYTYRLVVEFNDNEKNVEYSKNLGTVMQLDGVKFPTVRWEETRITWEQINGSIVIDDPDGTLQSNIYKVVYKNSLDMYTVNTIVTETPQNVIPITVNYLRANETYTFDVYGSINLQDGNPTATQTYIGSVNVQTKSPKRLAANFSKTDSPSDVFAISFALTDGDENASFEASTLTSINFTLYQGTTTDGKVEVFKKKIDLNDNEYASTLKQMFYDDSAIINADFFDSTNDDFHQKTYTLVVDGAYDYTGYDSNIIPIDNNIYQFDVNNYIPDLPDPDEPQINIRQVVNKFATSFGLEYDENLDPNTVVALNASPIYNNSSNNAKYLIYHVWIKNTETQEYEMIEELDRQINFNADGTMPATLFEVGRGTEDNVKDLDMLRRGNDYFLSFEVYLDIDEDGEIDTIYPKSIDENFVLKSEEIRLKKQEASFKLYPSLSGADYMTWKYMYNDYDNALINKKLYGFLNANASPSSSPDITPGNDYQVVTFTGLSKGKTLTIKKDEKLYKNNPHAYASLTSQYFYGYQSSINLSYTVTAEDNLVTFAINDYNNKTAIIDSISSMDILIEPVNAADRERLGTKLIENVTLKNGRTTVDYFQIKEYFNIDIRLRMVANYDTGEIGFDYTSDVMALQNGTYAEVGNYYTLSGQNLTQVSSVYGNAMRIGFNVNDKLLTVTNNADRTIEYTVDIDQTGVVYNNNNILAKNIRSGNLSSSNNVIKFDYIIPGISMYDDSNKIRITPLLTGVYVNADLIGLEDVVIQDNLIYFELFETNANGTNAQYVETLSYNVSEFNESILIDNLKHKTNYYIKVYANVFNPSRNIYEKQYLYDVDQQAVECNYNFHTLSDVGIKNVNITFVANSYMDKRVKIDYELENVTGYNYIAYGLYKKVGNSYVRTNVYISRSTTFFKNMHLEVNAAPSADNELVYGGEYQLIISAYGEYSADGETREINLGSKTTSFEIPNYKEPYVGISAGKSEDTIYFRITINDVSHVIDNDVYDIRLLDSEHNVVASQSNISVRSINRRFEFDGETYGLINGEPYTIDVITRNDYTNTRANLVVTHKLKSIQFGSSIDLGTVVLSENKSLENGFDLIFSDSYRLTDVKRISYSVSSVNTGFYITKSGNFNVRYDSSLGLYIYLIDLSDVELEPDNVYLFTFNFYDEDGLLAATTEIDYYNGGQDEEAP